MVGAAADLEAVETEAVAEEEVADAEVAAEAGSRRRVLPRKRGSHAIPDREKKTC